jgi:broad specificity phosphatase PhoE
MKLYLLRHAQRKHGKKQDQLTLKGKLQALKLKKFFQHIILIKFIVQIQMGPKKLFNFF